MPVFLRTHRIILTTTKIQSSHIFSLLLFQSFSSSTVFTYVCGYRKRTTTVMNHSARPMNITGFCTRRKTHLSVCVYEQVDTFREEVREEERRWNVVQASQKIFVDLGQVSWTSFYRRSMIKLQRSSNLWFCFWHLIYNTLLKKVLLKKILNF